MLAQQVEKDGLSRKRPSEDVRFNRAKKAASGSHSTQEQLLAAHTSAKEKLRQEIRDLRQCYERLCLEKGAADSCDKGPFQQLLLACQGMNTVMWTL